MKHFLVVVFFLISPYLFAEEPPTPPESSNHHSIGVEASRYLFNNSLHEQNSDTWGYGLFYEYRLPTDMVLQPTLGFDVSTYNTKNGVFRNYHVLATPYLKVMLQQQTPSFGLIFGFDADFWRQTSTVTSDLILHEDLLFGVSGGFELDALKKPWGTLSLKAIYHLQEYDMRTSFTTISASYAWEFI
jgi:hypothetical protein